MAVREHNKVEPTKIDVEGCYVGEKSSNHRRYKKFRLRRTKSRVTPAS